MDDGRWRRRGGGLVGSVAIAFALLWQPVPAGAGGDLETALLPPPALASADKPDRALLSNGGATMRGGSVRFNEPPGVATVATQSVDWCDRVGSGPGGRRDIAVDLSAAHGLVREFGVDSAFHPADTALTDALSSSEALVATGIADALGVYDDHLADVCSVPADDRTLGPGRVEVVNRVAIVTPGTTTPPIPASAKVVALDLRGLPATRDLATVLSQTVAPLLVGPTAAPARWERGHAGPVDEVLIAENVYATFLSLNEQPPVPGHRLRPLPLVVLTGDVMPPAAAWLAGTLRTTGRAWVLGSDVVASVAESAWRGVADGGTATRTAVLDRIFRREPPAVVRGLTVKQDDPFDPTTSSYRRDLAVEGADIRNLRVTVDGAAGVDLDLFLLYDVDGDNAFAFPDELIAYSATVTADEEVQLFVPPSGRYQVWVHGYDLGRAATTRFTLTTDQLAGALWPDVISADRRSSGDALVEVAQDARAVVTTPPAPVQGTFARSFPAPVFPFGQSHPPVTGRPQMRAALVAAHGVTRQFFPYFDVVGDGIDTRLLETLAAVEAWDGTTRGGAFDLLRRFGEVLHDGHQFVRNYGDPITAGYIPVRVELVGGRPVVRRSAHVDIHPGDAIVAIGGRPIGDLYADEYRLTSTATPGYQFDVASRYVLRLSGPTDVTLADPDGAVRTITVEPAPPSVFTDVNERGTTERPSGPLTDLGAPQLYYLNLNTFTSPTDASVTAAIAEAQELDSAGMVVDMRDYPGGNHYFSAARLMGEPFLSPHFVYRVALGPDTAFTFDGQFPIDPLTDPSFTGPIALLVGPHTVSAAENFSQMLVGAERPSVVIGARSAGTNGNITGAQLPGGFGFMYTGMQLLNPDGSRFHGIGIVPDINVPVTAEDLRDGVDRDLLTAIAQLSH